MDSRQEDLGFEQMTLAIDRREFLATCGKTAIVVQAMAFTSLSLGSLLTGCVEDGDPAQYYIARKAKLLEGFDKGMEHTKEVYVSRFGDRIADIVRRDTRSEYELLIPQLPYIGGKSNLRTRILIECAGSLAIFRTLRRRGMTTEEIGKFIYETTEVLLNRYPKIVLRLMGRFTFTWFSVEGMKRAGTISQQRRYPGDWVYSVIEGDGKEFDFGMDFTECAICKFFHAQGADELTPYMCSIDHITSEGLGLGMMRTMTLAEGGEKCDFRCKKGGPTKIKVVWKDPR